MTIIVTTSPGFGKHANVANLIEMHGWKLVRCIDPDMSDGALLQHLNDADFLVVGLIPLTRETITNTHNLKGVLKHGVGTENIDISACSDMNLPVVNTPGANADAVAELAIGLMFALARNIASGHMSVTSGRWNRLPGSQLGGKTLGIVGLGNIGRRLSILARGLGMHVIATDPMADQKFANEYDIELADIDTVLKQSDYVSLHIFGGADNKALIDADKLSLMQPNACLLNLARGEVVDLDAVAIALDSNKLGGVAIDAYVSEPPNIEHPIFSHPRAVFAPHSGADTQEAFENMGLMVIEDIECLLRGELPQRCLNANNIDH